MKKKLATTSVFLVDDKLFKTKSALEIKGGGE